MSWWTYLAAVLAGVGGGIAASVAGMASLIAYPALLAIGLPPLSANVATTVANVFGGAGAISASRPELTGQGRRLWPVILATMAGGVTGALVLLAAPARTFAYVSPWLIAFAAGAILVPTGRPGAHPRRRRGLALTVGAFLVGVYGGYFGAAAGVLMLALVLATTAESLPRATAIKNVISVAFNIVASIVFVLIGPVRWWYVLPLGLGFLLGGRVGPAVVRRVPPRPLRLGIALAGLALAVYLGWDVYR